MNGEELQRQMDVLRAQARKQAVGTKLLVDQANRLDLPVSEADVDERLARLVANAGGREKMDELMRRQNLTEPVLRDNIRQGRRVDKLVEKISGEVREPTEADMEMHFRNHSSEYRRPARALAQHILLKPASSGPEDRQACLSRLQEIRHRIEDGAEFGDEATMHSECPSGKQAGGSLGWIVRGTMIPQIDEAVFSMAVGELSQIIESPLGLHIIRKTEQEESREASYEDVHDQIRDFLRHAYRGEAISAYVAELREKAVIEGET
jgi:peptidyl-prolyl cis-trans isomerase C